MHLTTVLLERVDETIEMTHGLVFGLIGYIVRLYRKRVLSLIHLATWWNVTYPARSFR